MRPIIHSREKAPHAVAHLVGSGSCIDPNQAIRVVYQLLPNRSRHIRIRIFRVALGIMLLILNVCAQKSLICALSTPTMTYINTHTHTYA